MEVHHHPQVEKKNFKEYFLEFLMIFLAVTLGFIAENIRESISDSSKGKQYIQSFCEDLKDDTIELTRIAADFKSKDEALNDISKCYDSVSQNLPYTVCIKQIFLSSQSFENFNNSDRTLQQLKNAGGLRLLSTADADSVAVYDHMVRDYELDETTVVQETQTTLRSIGDELFSYVVQNNNDFSVKNIFVTDDRVLINKYFNTLRRYNNYCKKNYKALEQIKLKAVNLRKYFINKYNFK